MGVAEGFVFVVMETGEASEFHTLMDGGEDPGNQA